MKTKGLTDKIFRRRILSLILCVLVVLTAILFAGCDVNDEDWEEDDGDRPTTSYGEFIDGFKVVYANKIGGGTSENITDQTNDLITDSELQLLLNYGYGSTNQTCFPDSIRMLVISDTYGNATRVQNGSDDYSWEWTINPNIEGISIEDVAPTNGTLYTNWIDSILGRGDSDDINLPAEENRVKYNFSNLYADALNIILYEIMLGYDNLTTFEVTFEEEVAVPEASYVDNNVQYNVYKDVFTIRIKDSQKESIISKKIYEDVVGYKIKEDDGTRYDESTITHTQEEPDPEIVTKDGPVFTGGYLKELHDDYVSKTRYIGFTKQNADKLINYILDNVIGYDLVYRDYRDYRLSSNYRHDINSTDTYYTYTGTDSYDHNNNGFVTYYEYYHDQNANNVLRNTTYVNGTYNYYNYRNYVKTIANIIYSLTYDGSGDEWAFNYQYTQGSNKTPVSGTATTYNYVSTYKATHAQEEPGQGGYTAKPVTYLHYFEGEAFFEDPDASFEFSNVPEAEYQSVIVIPATNSTTIAEGGLKLEAGFSFNFASLRQDLVVNMKVRYYVYDAESDTGILYEFDMDPVEFTSADADTSVNPENGVTYYVNGFDASLDTNELDPSLVVTERDSTGYDSTYYTIGHFTESKGPTEETSLLELNEKYKVVASQNGYGGLTIVDEKKMDCSFFEIVFDPVKSPDDANTNYDFRMVVAALFGIY